MSKKKKILVTGASGFVGRAIVKKLQGFDDYETYEFFGKGKEEAQQKLVQRAYYADISNPDLFQKAADFAKTDIFIHTAGLAHQFGPVKQEDFWRVNVQGTENACTLASKIGVKHFVLISSVSVYGDYGASDIDETFVCNPIGFYAKSKLESENRALESCAQNGIRLTILRLATVIGENDPGNTSRLITAIDRRRFFWVGDGHNKKSLIYKEDIADGILRLIETEQNFGNEIYNLTAEAITMKEIVEEISRNLGRQAPHLAVPAGLVHKIFQLNKKTVSLEFLKKYEKTFEKWKSDDIFSGRKFYKKYNFRPKTPISEAIARQVKYYLNTKK